MTKNTIPVVFSADANYGYPMIFSELSMIRHAKEDTHYEFILLVSHDFPQKYKDVIDRHAKEADMLVRYIDMQDAFEDVNMHIKHITQATYYRLKLPGLLPDIDKCLYLDVDIVVQNDLTELYEQDMEEYYIAGVKAAGYYYPPEKKQRNMDRLEMPVFDQYINAGVLLMNLKKLREDHMEEQFEKLMERDYSSQDQDILNVACYGKIKILPLKYNVMNKYYVSHPENYDTDQRVSVCFSREEFEEAGKDPYIIHFADRWKPWDDMVGDMAEKWWEEVMASGEFVHFFEDFYLEIQKHQRRISETQQKENEAFREKVLNERRKIENKYNKVRDEKAALRIEKNERINGLKQRIAEKNERINGLKENVVKKRESIDSLKKRNQALTQEIAQIKNSRSYKISRALTWLPRKLKSLLKR